MFKHKKDKLTIYCEKVNEVIKDIPTQQEKIEVLQEVIHSLKVDCETDGGPCLSCGENIADLDHQEVSSLGQQRCYGCGHWVFSYPCNNCYFDPFGW